MTSWWYIWRYLYIWLCSSSWPNSSFLFSKSDIDKWPFTFSSPFKRFHKLKFTNEYFCWWMTKNPVKKKPTDWLRLEIARNLWEIASNQWINPGLGRLLYRSASWLPGLTYLSETTNEFNWEYTIGLSI